MWRQWPGNREYKEKGLANCFGSRSGVIIFGFAHYMISISTTQFCHPQTQHGCVPIKFDLQIKVVGELACGPQVCQHLKQILFKAMELGSLGNAWKTLSNLCGYLMITNYKSQVSVNFYVILDKMLGFRITCGTLTRKRPTVLVLTDHHHLRERWC